MYCWNSFYIKQMCLCLVQVPAIAVSVSALPKNGGCLETTVSVMIASATNTTVSSAQVMNHCHKHTS